MKSKYPYGLSSYDFCTTENGFMKMHKISANISIGSIRDSCHYGPFKIIRVDHIDRNSIYYYEIQFIRTGSRIVCPRSSIISGKVKDPEIYKLYIGKIYRNRSGEEFEIIEYTGENSHGIHTFNVRFIDSRVIVNSDIYMISIGKVKDLAFHIQDTSFLYGDIEFIKHIRSTDKQLYRTIQHRWCSMLSRCYDQTNVSYHNYGGKGIYVCDRWHIFSNYLNDITTIDGYDRDLVVCGVIELDKDLLQPNIINKCYSPETCVWISTKDNNWINMKRNSKVQRLS